MKILFILLFISLTVHAAPSSREEVSMAEQMSLRQSLKNTNSAISSFGSPLQAVNWIAYQSRHLEKKIPDVGQRSTLLRAIHYEATRAGLDPNVVLALIEIESGFDRFAISSVGASGMMQVMPFWRDLIGDSSDSLFDIRTNLRYGCIILKHYMDKENGNLTRALARYNGSLGSPVYPNLVFARYAKYNSQ